MSGRREDLIAELASASLPVRRAGRLAVPVTSWLIAAGALALIAMLLAGPFRVGALQQLLASPRRVLEAVLGGGAIVTLAIAAFRSGIPGHSSRLRQTAVPLLFLLAWIGAYVAAWLDPDVAYSMAGKRGHCWIEALLYGVPGLLIGCLALRRLFPLHGAWSGMLLGLAAGAMPAMLMQLACMWEPGHILLLHILPGLALGAVGAVVGAIMLRRS